MGQRWTISDRRWDSRLSLRLLRLGLLGVWSTLALAFVVGALHAGTLNQGAISRTRTPPTFWLVVASALVAAVTTLVYNLHLFLRRPRGSPGAR